jgi:hypothetical protein
MSTTCPEGLGSLSNNVYTTLPISGDCSVTATFAAASTALSVTVTNNHDYARYGTLANYVVTVTNNSGSSVTGLSIAGSDTSATADLDTAGGRWLCFASATQCAPSGNGPFTDVDVSVPANGSVTWLVTVPVLADAPDTEVSYTVTLSGGGPDVIATDTDTLTIFRDGFDSAYGDGARPTSMSAGSWDTLTVLSFGVSPEASAMIESVVNGASSDNSRFRIEQLNGEHTTWLRIVAIDAFGVERVSAWAVVKPHAVLTMAVAQTQGQSMLIVLGAEDNLDIPIASATAWRIERTAQE